MFQVLAGRFGDFHASPVKQVVSWGVPGRLDMSGTRPITPPPCVLALRMQRERGRGLEEGRETRQQRDKPRKTDREWES
jgi:hypothetical protein